MPCAIRGPVMGALFNEAVANAKATGGELHLTVGDEKHIVTINPADHAYPRSACPGCVNVRNRFGYASEVAEIVCRGMHPPTPEEKAARNAARRAREAEAERWNTLHRLGLAFMYVGISSAFANEADAASVIDDIQADSRSEDW